MRDSTFIFGDDSANSPFFWSGHYEGASSQQRIRATWAINYLDAPSTTSATNYKIQIGVNDTSNSGSLRAFESSQTGMIMLLEIGA